MKHWLRKQVKALKKNIKKNKGKNEKSLKEDSCA